MTEAPQDLNIWVINSTNTRKWNLINHALIFLVPFVLVAISIGKDFIFDNKTIAILCLSYVSRVYIYPFIEYSSDIIISEKGSDLFIQFLFFKIKLDREKCFLRQERFYYKRRWGGDGIYTETLVLVRDAPFFVNRLFKNKIRLYNNNETDLKEMKCFLAQKFKIAESHFDEGAFWG